MDTISMLKPLLNCLVCDGTLPSSHTPELRHRYRYIAVSARADCNFRKKVLGPNPRNSRATKRRNTK